MVIPRAIKNEASFFFFRAIIFFCFVGEKGSSRELKLPLGGKSVNNAYDNKYMKMLEMVFGLFF